ncbi:Per1-like-domain-containing protein [Phyllosticta citriasiana]|uniref:Per1-like-domain-containing protein n=1 Tax=Phyllosticta citriasiana TaxID=595635 RepID=UPI0030FD571E
MLVLALALCIGTAQASVGDRLPDFKNCVKVCIEANCDGPDKTHIRSAIHRRLTLWTCPSECDYTCQHITTHQRLARDPPYREPILQFHGKWPFHRFLGMQEPFSVLFSLLNYLAHLHGLSLIRSSIPPSYPLRKYYIGFALAGMHAWIWSMLFHTRDLPAQRRWTTSRWRQRRRVRSVLHARPHLPARRAGAAVEAIATAPLPLARPLDYTYNMAANVAAGVVQNLLWSWFSVRRYRALKRGWAAGLRHEFELLDFPPWGGMVDAHARGHAGTIIPTVGGIGSFPSSPLTCA